MAIFSVSGIRGKVPEELGAKDYREWGLKFKEFMGKDFISVGMDSRPSSSYFYYTLISSLLGFGSNVFSLGCLSTPAALFVSLRNKIPGIMITASHNPLEWNGMKFIHPNGRFLFPEELTKFKSFSFKEETIVSPGRAYELDAKSLHISGILESEFLDFQRKGFRVGVDAVNGSAGWEAKKLIENLGCKVYELNLEPTGEFPRPPEPTPENIKELSNLVKEKRLDLGFALDPDGDRVSVVDEEGRALGEEYTLPLACLYILERERSDIVTNLSTSMLADEVAKRFDVKLIRTPVGEANVVKKMLEKGALIGGEGNGGVIFPKINLTRDGILAIGLILALKAKQGSIKEIIDSFPRYKMVKKKIPKTDKISENIIDKIISKFPNANISQEDGIWVKEDKFFLHLRESNTEPILRLVAEGVEPEYVEQRVKEVLKIWEE